MKRKGFPPGSPINRLSDEQRQILIDMLRAAEDARCCAAVTRAYNESVGKVTLQTVCTIKNGAIEAGILHRVPLKKEDPAYCSHHGRRG